MKTSDNLALYFQQRPLLRTPQQNTKPPALSPVVPPLIPVKAAGAPSNEIIGRWSRQTNHDTPCIAYCSSPSSVINEINSHNKDLPFLLVWGSTNGQGLGFFYVKRSFLQITLLFSPFTQPVLNLLPYTG